jgi:hypothetical protein
MGVPGSPWVSVAFSTAEKQHKNLFLLILFWLLLLRENAGISSTVF